MFKLWLGIAIGAVTCGAFCFWLARPLLEEKFEYGRKHGRLDGLVDAMKAIELEFGSMTYPARPENYRGIFAVKSSAVVAIDVDGVPTIRVLH